MTYKLSCFIIFEFARVITMNAKGDLQLKYNTCCLTLCTLEFLNKDFTTKGSNLIYNIMIGDTIIAPSLESFFQENSINETIHSHRIFQ